ncbi:hypothetical protein V6N13_057304 [Hibiscus sabdariffa]
MSNPPGMVGRRARKRMSGAANDSTTKFPISGKVPLECLMHRLTLRGNSIGGVSRPSNVRASDLIKSQWAPCFMHPTVEPHYSSMSSPCGHRAQGALFARSLCILSLDTNDALALLWPLPCLVKKLVVGPRGGSAGPPHGEHRSARPYCRRCAPGLNWPGRSSGAVTVKKLECSKQAYACIR